jgi:heme/copper-type cytochrome/quinol oxidase subunit 3
MAIVSSQTTETASSPPPSARRPAPSHVAPVTPGKVAVWLFLATEVMFFTGLIGSYIVLRAGSPASAYSNLYRPAMPLTGLSGTYGVVIDSVGKQAEKLEPIVQSATGIKPDQAELLIKQQPAVVADLTQETATKLQASLAAEGAICRVQTLETSRWPRPFDRLTNPLSIHLTALNTFILSCSSIAMMMALASIQKGRRWKGTLYLGLTFLIGSLFLSIQASEYKELLFERQYPAGISASGHFRPDSSLFASCFFAMTGFHGLHVTGGLIAVLAIFVGSLFGVYTKTHYAPVEIVGLYWHFVDVVWVVLFTIVYLI